jgi:hypothetical protein
MRNRCCYWAKLPISSRREYTASPKLAGEVEQISELRNPLENRDNYQRPLPFLARRDLCPRGAKTSVNWSFTARHWGEVRPEQRRNLENDERSCLKPSPEVSLKVVRFVKGGPRKRRSVRGRLTKRPSFASNWATKDAVQAAQLSLDLEEGHREANEYGGAPPILHPDEAAAAILLGKAFETSREVLAILRQPDTLAIIEVPHSDFVDPINKVLRKHVLGPRREGACTPPHRLS